MRVIWEVEDGYAGGSRPHYLDIPDEELADCESEEEKQELIHEYVQDDFEQKVTWSITRTEDE